MKKGLLTLAAAFVAVTMSADALLPSVNDANLQLLPPVEGVQKAPAGLQAIHNSRVIAKAKKRANLPASTISDFKGAYTYEYDQYSGSLSGQPDTLSTLTHSSGIVTIGVAGEKARINGLFAFPVTATLGTSGNYTTLTVDEAYDGSSIVYYSSSYGPVGVVSVWYYEGDDTYSAGWYYGSITLFALSDYIIFDTDVQFYYVIQSGQYANYRLGGVTAPGATLVPDDSYNGIMTYSQSVNVTADSTAVKTNDVPLVLTQDADTKVVSAEGFGGFSASVDIAMNVDSTFSIEPQVVVSNTTGDFYTTDVKVWYVDSNFAEVGAIEGKGTETKLTFTGSYGWTAALVGSGRWYGQRTGTSIELLSGVFEYPVLPASIVISEAGGESPIYVRPGDSYQIEYSVLPENATDKSVVFASSDESLATVSESGLVTFASADAIAALLARAEDDADIKNVTITATSVANPAVSASIAFAIDSTVTGVETINSTKSVANVKYVNAAGQRSNVAFDGVNIVVTTYIDGTVNTSKVIK